jgi:hypothetical protein
VLALGVLVLRSDVDAFARAFGERIAARVDVPPEAFLASLLPGEAAANRDLLGRGLCALGLALLFAPLLRAVPRLGSGAGPFVVATAVELLPVALLLTPAPAASSVAAAPSLLAPVLQAGLEREPRARLVRYEPPTAADPGARALADVRLLPPNLTRVFGIPDATGYAPLPSRRSKAFFELVEPGGTSPGTGLACFRRAESLESPLLDLLRVEWVLASGTLESERWNEVATRGDATLYRRTSELPRARLFFRSRRLEPERVAVALQTGLDPLNEAILEPERSPPADLLSEGEGEVFVLKETARRVDLEVTCSAPAILALADAWAPGWKVSVVGAREQESLPVHLFLRGVDLEAGRHHVVFEYTPSPFVLGAALSIASLVLTLLWVLLPDRWLGPLVKSEGVEGNG